MRYVLRYFNILAVMMAALFAILLMLVAIGFCKRMGDHNPPRDFRAVKQESKNALEEPAPMLGIDFVAWHLLLITGAVPLAWLISRIFLREEAPGFCPTCGYDMRATPQRCPECGTVAGTPVRRV